MGRPGTVIFRVDAGGASSAKTVTLFDHAWAHATRNHPEVASLLNEVKETIIDPSAIYQSNTDPTGAVLFFNHSVVDASGQALSVPINLANGVIKTVCFRNTGYTGRLIWKK